MREVDLKDRTKEFAKRIIEICRNLPENRDGRLIGNQLFRSSTSIGANYRSACRAKSLADFIAKLSIVEEETDETLYWLELLDELKIVPHKIIKPIHDEANEILAIIVSSIKTSRKRKNKTQ